MKTQTIDIDDCRNDHIAERDALELLWDSLKSPELLVVDDYGVNVSDGSVRHLAGETWVYQDSEDGFLLIEEPELRFLNLIVSN